MEAAPRVLVIEDSKTDVFLIREALETAGVRAEIDVVHDGQAALRFLDEGARPALVLLDLNLPKIPGIQVLAELRQSPSCATVPVVVVTSSDSESDLQAIAELGVTSYFRKPHSLDAFMSLSDVIKGALAVG